MLRFLRNLIGFPIGLAGLVALCWCSFVAYYYPDHRGFAVIGAVVGFVIMAIGGAILPPKIEPQPADDWDALTRAELRARTREAEAAAAIAEATILAARQQSAESRRAISRAENG